MPRKSSKTCPTSCDGNIDAQMLQILIGCAETPTDPATLLSMIKVYGFSKVAAYANLDPSDENHGKVTEEGLALALNECDENIICTALCAKDADGDKIFNNIDEINTAATN